MKQFLWAPKSGKAKIGCMCMIPKDVIDTIGLSTIDVIHVGERIEVGEFSPGLKSILVRLKDRDI